MLLMSSLTITLIAVMHLILSVVCNASGSTYVEELEDATFDDRVEGEIWMIKFYAPYVFFFYYFSICFIVNVTSYNYNY